MGRKIVAVIIMLFAFMVVPMTTMASSAVTIEGEVNDSFQIVDNDGQVYEIADTDQGNDLSENHIGEKAKVTGTVELYGNVKIIKVSDFEVLTD